jgi:hypothetical protein
MEPRRPVHTVLASVNRRGSERGLSLGGNEGLCERCAGKIGVEVLVGVVDTDTKAHLKEQAG